jgi:cell division protein FtsN
VPEGLVKNDLGWVDSKNKVTYVQLENSKFAIQESAFNSADNANKRLAAIEKISGLKGAVAKVDTGAKGTWYRVRLGVFSTLTEAQTKAAEFRSKEKK